MKLIIGLAEVVCTSVALEWFHAVTKQVNRSLHKQARARICVRVSTDHYRVVTLTKHVANEYSLSNEQNPEHSKKKAGGRNSK